MLLMTMTPRWMRSSWLLWSSISICKSCTPDHETIQINDIVITTTDSFIALALPASIGPYKHRTLCCKAGTGIGGSVIQLHMFLKLFPDYSDVVSQQACAPILNRLTACNGTPICHFGTNDRLMKWTPDCQDITCHTQTQWYSADILISAILGISTCVKFPVVWINCTSKLITKMKPQVAEWLLKPVTVDAHHLLICTKEDIICEVPNCLEGVRQFPICTT